MDAKPVDLGCVVACGLWAAMAVLLGAAILLDDMRVAATACATSAAAATATIRVYFVTQNRLMRNAFELGVDAGRQGRSGDRVTRLR